MPLSTRVKIAIARVASTMLTLARAPFGGGREVEVVRGGVRWRLDLREGFDLAVFLGVHERSTARALARLVKPGATVLDIGANIGAHTLPLAALVGPTGRVVAFEPTAFAVEKLRKSLALNPELVARVTVEHALLTDDAAVPPAIYSSWPLSERDGLHPKHLGKLMPTDGARAVRLDDYLAEKKVERVDVVKLDVDGYEAKVLGGARDMLARMKPVIVMELAPYVLDERSPTALADVIASLAAAGYRLEHEESGEAIALEIATIRATVPDGTMMNVIARC